MNGHDALVFVVDTPDTTDVRPIWDELRAHLPETLQESGATVTVWLRHEDYVADEIGKARADERERIARAIEATASDWAGSSQAFTAFAMSARVARGERR